MARALRLLVCVSLSGGLLAAPALTAASAPAPPPPLTAASSPAPTPNPTPAPVPTPAAGGLLFAGRSWTIKAGAGLLGPGPNLFSNSLENVWVDAVGQLHLRITNRDGQWQAAEVLLDESLGYGTYSFTVASPVGSLDPNVVLGLFTWSDDPAYSHRELDVEVARWGIAGGPTNAQYVVAPSGPGGGLARFVVPPSTPSVHSFTWARRSVNFASAAPAGRPAAAWRFTGAAIPRPGGERARVNLWLYHGMPPVDGAPVEVVLSNFSFKL